MNKAIDIELTAAICEKCGISADRAAKELKAAKVASKTTGLPLADTLVHLGLV